MAASIVLLMLMPCRLYSLRNQETKVRAHRLGLLKKV